ncbi:MAG: hypothetical protein J0652_10995 [Desulfobulbaceae bacterium]|jgi:hypothetical protein|nr:hypothetical protein [Desulfobulbaceae bacterium]
MTTITFDTLKYTKRLRAAGFSEEQAEAFAEAQKDTLESAMDTTLATKVDIHAVRDDIRGLQLELRLLKWMCATTLGAMIAVLVRLFIH